MSNYHLEGGNDNQVEDGEMESPNGDSPMQLSKDIFSMSDEENEDTTDSLDIKPPQAKSYHARTSQPTSRSGSSRREKHSERSDSRREHPSSHSHSSAKGDISSHSSSKGHHRSRREQHRERRDERQSTHEKKRSHRERREAASRGAEASRGQSGSEAARYQDVEDKLEDLRKRLVANRSRGASSRHQDKRAAEPRESRSDLAAEPREPRQEFPSDQRGARSVLVDKQGLREMRKESRADAPEQRELRTDVFELRKDRSVDAKEPRMDRGAGWPEDGERRDFREPTRHEARRPEDRTVDERKTEVAEHKRSEEHRERHERRGQERPPPQEKVAERGEGAPRKEFLLEASRQKEIYQRELEARRERRNMEKELERTMREKVRKRERSRSRSRQRKNLKQDEEPENDDQQQVSEPMDVVDVSDDSSATDEAAEGEEDKGDEEGEETEEGEEEEEEEEEEGSSDSADDDSDSKTDTDTQAAADTDDSPGGDTDEEKVVTSRAPSVSDDDTDSFADRRQADGQNGSSPGEPTDVLEEDELPPYLPAVSGCRSVEEFQCLNRIEEGTYGVVYRARDRSNEEVVALKRLKMEKEKEGFPITSLREINTLLKAQHLNIVTVREIVVGSNMDKIFIVMDYVEHDLKSLMETMKQKKQVFIPGEVKCLMQQLLRAVSHLHDNWILHRDLKTSNLLLSHKGILKVGDFGLAREYGSPLKAYTPIVVTLWYRSPELLLCTKEYSTPIDMWSVGCIFGEFLSMEALFPGKSEVDQINRIFKDLGTPTDKVWPDYKSLPAVQKMNFTSFPPGNLRKRFGTMITELGMDLFNKFLTYEPASRVTADDALKHAYFDESPLSIDPAMFPTWPAKSELGHRKPAGQASPKPPPGGAGYKQLGDTDERVPDPEGFHMGGMEARRAPMGPGFSLKF